MATVVTPAFTATGVDVVVDPSGTYRVVHNGAVLLESAEAGACGIQHEGKWCTCKTGSPGGDGAAAGIDDSAACYLHLLNQSRTEGSDALGTWKRTELQWGTVEGAGRALLVAAVRV